MALADLPLAAFLNEALVPYEDDEVTRLIIDSHDAAAFAPVARLTVGEFRDWLLGDGADERSAAGARGRPHAGDGRGGLEDLPQPGPDRRSPRKCRVVTRFRNTIGLAGPAVVAAAAQPSDRRSAGMLASILDGLLLGCGDAVIGINPATDSPRALPRCCCI